MSKIIKSDEEIDALLEHKNNGAHRVRIIGSGNHGKGGGENKPRAEYNRDKDDHAEVAVLAELVTGKEASKITGISEATISKYRNGKNSNNIEDPELKEKVETRLNKINGTIVDKVDTLLTIFTESKMDELKAGEIPTSVEKLIGTFDKINRRNDKNSGDGPRVLVNLYAPRQNTINEYITKEV